MIVVDLAVLALIQQSREGTELPLWLTMSQTWAEIIWRGATVLAIFAGGLFTYYKFIRGREFAGRVEPQLSAGRTIRRDETIILQVEASAKNIGLSKVNIDHASTCVSLELRERGAAAFEELQGKYSVFESQNTLEPNEVVGEPVWIEIADGDYLAAKLHLNFIATGHSARRAWRATSLVDLAGSADHRRLF